jgi:hypothetical protein
MFRPVSVSIHYGQAGEAMHLAGNPSEAAFFVGVRIVNPRHLARRREEILLNE